MKEAASSRVWNIGVSPAQQDSRSREIAEWAERPIRPVPGTSHETP